MKQLPSPSGSSLSQLMRVRRDFLGYLRQAACLGDLVRLRPAPRMTIVLVNHPSLIREVLVTRAAEFRKTRMTGRLVGKFLGGGLVLSEGDEHQAQRRHLAPFFVPRRLADCVTPLFTRANEYFSRHAEEGLQVQEAMTELALQGMLQVLFGSEEDSTAVQAAMRVFADSMAQRFRSIPLPDWVPSSRNRADRAAIRALNSAIVGLVAKRRSSAAPGGGDVLGAMLAAEDGRELTFNELRDQVTTLYFAGHETTAKLLTWATLLIANHPEIGAALAAEASTLPDSPSVDDLERLPLLDAVINETLRLYPPAWVFDREPFADVDLGGTTLPAGMAMYVSPYVLHRDARWFPQPATFLPSRFAHGWETRIDRSAYFPFGLGARHCIGRALALAQGKATLAALLRTYRLGTDVTDLDSLASPGATLGLSRPVILSLRPA